MGKINAITVFCGSADKVDPAHHAAAASLGSSLAERGIRLVYGGEKAGLLGVLSNACIAAGGAVTGVIPAVLREKGLANEAVSDLVIVGSLQERKRVMTERADAYIALPGGLGTLDEAVDAIATRYMGTHEKPVVLVNTAGFYAPFLATFDHMMAAGFCAPWQRALFKVAATPEEALSCLHA